MKQGLMESQSTFTLEPTFFHGDGWLKLLESTYSYQRFDIRGEGFWMPLLKVGPLFGRRLVSIPFSDYGGPVGQIRCDDLTQHVKQVLRQSRCDYVEIRTSSQELASKLVESGFVQAASYITRLSDTDSSDTEQALEKRVLGKTAKRYIAKAEKAGVAIREVESISDLTRAYKTYFNAVKELGSPCHSKTLLLNLKAMLGDACRIFIASMQGRDVAVAAFLVGADRVHLWLIYCSKEYKKLGVIYLLDWVGIKLANQLGLKYFDFGRTRSNSGVDMYKHHWLGHDEAIYHLAYYGSTPREPPDPMQPRFRAYAAVWRRLPDFVVGFVGPKVIRSIAL
jgi:predicted N-acyltransferase